MFSASRNGAFVRSIRIAGMRLINSAAAGAVLVAFGISVSAQTGADTGFMWRSQYDMPLGVPLQVGALRLGHAQAKITPPDGMPMGGGFVMRASTGINDELFCKALVLENGGTKAGLVACDVESLHRPIVESARALIDKTTGLRGANVMITGTHTHSGPEMTP